MAINRVVFARIPPLAANPLLRPGVCARRGKDRDNTQERRVDDPSLELDKVERPRAAAEPTRVLPSPVHSRPPGKPRLAINCYRTRSPYIFLGLHCLKQMTTTNRLGDYVIFFQETLSKTRRHKQSKMTRAQTRKRLPRARHKLSLAEILTKNSGQRVFSSPNQIEQELASEARQHQSSGGNARITTGTLSVKMDRVQTQGRGKKAAAD